MVRDNWRWSLTVVVIAGLLLLPIPGARASDGVQISTETAESAQVVVNGLIGKVKFLEHKSMAYRAIEVSVSESVVGSAPASLYLAVAGGRLNDGTEVLVSHAPAFSEGESVQLALGRPGAGLADAVAQTVGAERNDVYVLVGGESGVFRTSGVPLSALGAVATQGVGDYRLIGSSWPDFVPPATYHINTSGSGLDAQSAIAAIDAAANAWERDSRSAIDFRNGGTTGRAGFRLGDGFNTLSFQNRPGESWLGQASWAVDRYGEVNFDIVFNTKFKFATGAGGGFDLETVALHEFGHILGLAHVSARSEIMYSLIESGVSKGLGSGDRAGVRYLYPGADLDECFGKAPTVRIGQGEVPTPGDDVIVGTAGSDEIDGGGGNDLICGGEGNDRIYGGPGNDKILGGDGNDSIWGGDGRDAIRGGNGDDKLWGQAGPDEVRGQGGNDRIHGGGGHDRLFGLGGSDEIIGESGDDLIQGGYGDDSISGGDGNDTIIGQNGADTLSGGPGDDDLAGGRGHDQVAGDSGSDLVKGGDGSDRLVGGADDDILKGGANADSMDGGTDADVCDGQDDHVGDRYLNCETTR